MNGRREVMAEVAWRCLNYYVFTIMLNFINNCLSCCCFTPPPPQVLLCETEDAYESLVDCSEADLPVFFPMRRQITTIWERVNSTPPSPSVGGSIVSFFWAAFVCWEGVALYVIVLFAVWVVGDSELVVFNDTLCVSISYAYHSILILSWVASSTPSWLL